MLHNDCKGPKNHNLLDLNEGLRNECGFPTSKDSKKMVSSRERSVLKSMPREAKLGRCRKIAPHSHAMYTDVKLMYPLHNKAESQNSVEFIPSRLIQIQVLSSL